MRKDKKTIQTIVIFMIFLSVTLLLSINFPYLSEKILPHTEWGIYDKSFWLNFLINMNASVLDFFVIGIVLYYLNDRSEKKEKERNKADEIREQLLSLKRELSDYAQHSTLELDLKKVGIIKRIQKLGADKICIQRIKIRGVELEEISLQSSDLTGLSLKSCKLKDCSFSTSNLRSLDLGEASLKRVDFKDCSIKNLKLIDSTLAQVVFENTDLTGSNFTNGDLQSCRFTNCNMSSVNFEKTNLRNANFTGCYNLNANSLSKAKNIDYIHVTEEIQKELKELNIQAKYRNLKRPA